MKRMPKKIAFLYNKSNTFGLRKDAEVLQEALKGRGYLFKSYDPLEPPVVNDIAFHLEVPVHGWLSWSSVNILVVNPEWYTSEWDSYLSKFTAIFCKDSKTTELFQAKHSNVFHVSWAIPPSSKRLFAEAKEEYVWFCAGSQNKRAMIPMIVDSWEASFPKLSIYTVSPIEIPNLSAHPNVELHVKDLSAREHEQIARSTKGHFVLSRSEGFGYTAAEAEQLGAYTIAGNLPCHVELYANSPNVHFVKFPILQKECAYILDTTFLPKVDLSCVKNFLTCEPTSHWEGFSNTIQTLVHNFPIDERMVLPPVLEPRECPPISIITLVYNRPKFIQNACLNLLLTDYPREKMEWVVVDDSDSDQSASDRIVQFEQTFAPGKVVYVPLAKKTSIGRKRNLGVKRASHSILLMMDDDDHYPQTSFRRRVAWLTRDRLPHDCSVCTTIAMYDLLKGQSAVNVPPMNLGLAKRCSEATLTFTKDFWKERPFPETDISEGEGFLQGRESRVVEMPPQHILVAFSHQSNISKRSLPDAGKGCFWGFDPAYLKFIHGIVGVSVENAS